MIKATCNCFKTVWRAVSFYSITTVRRNNFPFKLCLCVNIRTLFSSGGTYYNIFLYVILLSTFLWLNPNVSNSNKQKPFIAMNLVLNSSTRIPYSSFFSFWFRWSRWGPAVRNRFSSFRPDSRFWLGLGHKKPFRKRLKFYYFNITGPPSCIYVIAIHHHVSPLQFFPPKICLQIYLEDVLLK